MNLLEFLLFAIYFAFLGLIALGAIKLLGLMF
jgi:hypothetical protein